VKDIGSVTAVQPPVQPDGGAYVQLQVGTTLAAAERVLIFATLEMCHGNKTRAASMLGVSLKTLYNRLNEYRSESP
jgi:DNA-binding NtrC family response regulator